MYRGKCQASWGIPEDLQLEADIPSSQRRSKLIPFAQQTGKNTGRLAVEDVFCHYLHFLPHLFPSPASCIKSQSNAAALEP
jgi:hypothetical protein